LSFDAYFKRKDYDTFCKQGMAQENQQSFFSFKNGHAEFGMF
jgi:hypothetical protein